MIETGSGLSTEEIESLKTRQETLKIYKYAVSLKFCIT